MMLAPVVLLLAEWVVVVAPAAGPSRPQEASCPSACGQCPPPGSSGACCHGNQTCETGSWTIDTCTPSMGTWCKHDGPWPPQPPPPPCPPHPSRRPGAAEQFAAAALQRSRAQAEPQQVAAVGKKQKVFVVLRLDDISVGELLPNFTGGSVINWALKNQVKLNIGIMAGGPERGGSPRRTWPTDCSNRRVMDGRTGADDIDGDPLCADETVAALNSAYGNGNLVGQSGSPVIEIFDHSYLHYEWANLWPLNAVRFLQPVRHPVWCVFDPVCCSAGAAPPCSPISLTTCRNQHSCCVKPSLSLQSRHLSHPPTWRTKTRWWRCRPKI